MSIAVYTAIFGSYDTLRPVTVIDPDVDYICFTDTPINPPAPWQVRVVDLPHPDPRYASRYYFDQSTIVLPDYDYTIMHGGNAALTVLPAIILSFVQDTDIAAFIHPHRKSVYEEPSVCAMMGKGDSVQMAAQVKRYSADGFSGVPFSACTMLVRCNTPAIQEFEQLWWSEVVNGSHRDQLSFDYCRWKYGLPITYIPGDPFANMYVSVKMRHD